MLEDIVLVDETGCSQSFDENYVDALRAAMESLRSPHGSLRVALWQNGEVLHSTEELMYVERSLGIKFTDEEIVEEAQHAAKIFVHRYDAPLKRDTRSTFLEGTLAFA
jgi:hypothetical protein